VSSGAFYYGLNKITHLAFDTSASDTFTTAYVTGSTWTYTAGQTQISNSQYNNTATGLANITTDDYGVHWVYLMNDSPSSLMVVYGQGDYATLSLAREALEPTQNALLAGIASLIGRIIIKQ